VRVLTLNIFGRRAGWEDRRLRLIDGLRDLRPDVVTFQEAIKTEGYDHVIDLLGTDYKVFHQLCRTADGCGASIASRWRFSVALEADLHVSDRVDPAGWIGSLVVAELAVPEPIGQLFLVHHKPTWQSGLELERELQAVRSARLIEQLLDGSERHVVVAGD
jgi:hypothetical protein